MTLPSLVVKLLRLPLILTEIELRIFLVCGKYLDVSTVTTTFVVVVFTGTFVQLPPATFHWSVWPSS